MSFLPVITGLEVSDYEMYPGTSDEPGLHRHLEPGLTLIVGANGLGKTTLVTMLRHLVAGPVRLGNRMGGSFEAGQLRVTSVEVATFADRVADRAETAQAHLTMDVGAHEFRLTRRLKDLRLTSLSVDGQDRAATENAFQEEIVAAADVNDYADWLLLVDYLCFVTEDRAQPFWDRNVQRQLLRILTADAQAAGQLVAAESEHISADSEFRNARAQLGRHRERYQAQRAKVAGSGDVNDALADLSVSRSVIDKRIEEAEAALERATDELNSSAREAEVAEAEFQLAQEALEAARYDLIAASLPRQDDVIRYLNARLALHDACPACGQEGGHPGWSVEGASCFLCGLPLDRPAHEDAVADFDVLEVRVASAAAAVEAERHRRTEREVVLVGATAELARVRTERSGIEGQIRALRSQLPAGTTDLASTATLIADLEADLAVLREVMDDSRSRLDALIDDANERVRTLQDGIQAVFDDVATKFLVETCHLVPHQIPVRIGQEGERFQVQVFDLDLASSSELVESRRSNASQVSESQRVFIDIAFRVTLIRTCVAGRKGTMVIDAPEGSLDAVFSSNAAALLFELLGGEGPENRLVVASNLIEGSLLPALSYRAGIADASDPRLVNLLDVAAPTAAVVLRGDEYREVLNAALGRSLGDDQ